MFVLINSTPPPFTKDIMAMFEYKSTKKVWNDKGFYKRKP